MYRVEGGLKMMAEGKAARIFLRLLAPNPETAGRLRRITRQVRVRLKFAHTTAGIILQCAGFSPCVFVAFRAVSLTLSAYPLTRVIGYESLAALGGHLRR